MEEAIKNSGKTEPKNQVKTIQLKIVENAITILLMILIMTSYLPAEDFCSILIVLLGFGCFIKTLREIINSSTKLILVLIENDKLS